MSQYACPIDAAQEREMEMTDEALAAVRKLVPNEKHELTEADFECEICGEPGSIPYARASRGYTTCVHCQSMVESKPRKYDNRYQYRHSYDD